MNKVKLTVVTITYNQEKYIEKAIKSVVSQKTSFPFTYIVSDDKSTDNTRKIIEKYHKKYPDIIKPIYRNENLGSMLNFLETLNMVDTEYLAMCDGDDYWIDENKLQKQVDFLEKNKKYNICFHQTKIFFENKSQKDQNYPIEKRMSFGFDDILVGNIIPTNSVLYRWKFRKKDSLKKVFPVDMAPGDHFLHLLHLRDGKAKLINEVMSAYRRHEDGMWWLTIDQNNKYLFSLEYGKKHLNFYNNIIKEFNLPSTTCYYQRKIISNNLIKAYLMKRQFEQLAAFEKENEELYDVTINELTYVNPYDNLSKVKKICYLLIFDTKIFKVKILEKFKKLFRKK